MEEKKDYKYLFTLKANREKEKKIVEILKKQANVKEYLMNTILEYEEKKENSLNEKKFQNEVSILLKRIEEKLERINRNTEI